MMQSIKFIFYPVLILLSWSYGVIVFIRNKLFDLKWIETNYFDKPIISIGNITMGGTGKTPITIYLAKFILNKGKNPGIISRGYARNSRGIFIVHDGKKLVHDVKIVGDEPYLMGKLLEKVPIIVSENRTLGIKKLLNDFSIDVIIMDDGFQHRKVHRNLNIITISGNDSLKNYKLLPLGNLREPIHNIKRADLLIYTKTEKNPQIHSKIKFYYKQDLMHCIFQPILMKYNFSNYIEAQIPSEPVFAFCGIKESNSFFKSILKFGIEIKGKQSFRDHYNYNEKILKKLSNMIKDLKIKKVITTEKDIVKIPETFINNFEMYIIRINVIMKKETIINKKIDSLLLN